MGLDTVELIVAVETYFEIEIAAEEAERIYIVGDLNYTIVRKLRKKKHSKANMPYLQAVDIFALLQKIIHKQTGIDVEEIIMDASLTEDLGID